MWKPNRPGPNASSPPKPAAAPPPAVTPQERDRIAQLLAVNKSGPALDFAKDIHKRCHSAESETLLLDVYSARFTSLLDRGLDRDAAALKDLVRERFPHAQNRLNEWNAAQAAHHGDFSALLAPLNDPALPEDRRAALLATVRRNTTDLRALAECGSLAADHPLRTAAAELHAAFQAVTTGPTDEAAIALAGIPRSSPLAPWKMMVRAIAAYYRRDDALCERCLAAVEADAAPARLVPALRALLHPPKTPQSPATTALMSGASDALDALRSALKSLDAAFSRQDRTAALRTIAAAVAACQQAQPALVERLKQHISIRAMVEDLNAGSVAAAMGGPTLKNSEFWRLLARSYETGQPSPQNLGLAAAAWDEFRRHALAEGRLLATGPEIATLYLHMTDLVRRMDAEDLSILRREFGRRFDAFETYYRGQPPEIRAHMLPRTAAMRYFLSAFQLLERACQADPCTENFQRWLQDTKDDPEHPPAQAGRVAEAWNAALPNDIPPLLHLMQSAEQRNALQLAFKYMENAARIDGVNAEVRRARLRLLVSMAVRHLRQNKPKLAEKELVQIESLPEARQGDRPAFVAGLRHFWHLYRHEDPEAQVVAARIAGSLGPLAASVLLDTMGSWCGFTGFVLVGRPKLAKPLCAALGRACALANDMGMPFQLTGDMTRPLMEELSAKQLSAAPQELAALGEAAARASNFPLAYALSRAGLALGGDSRAEFLFLRARSLHPYDDERREACIAAASDLARHRHDSALLARIAEWRRSGANRFDIPEQAQAAMDAAAIGRVVESELKKRELTTPRRGAGGPRPGFGGAFFDPFDGDPDDDEFFDEDESEDGLCNCPRCLAERGEMPPMPPEFEALAEQFGPEAIAMALNEIIGRATRSTGKKKPRGRRRPRTQLPELPF